MKIGLLLAAVLLSWWSLAAGGRDDAILRMAATDYRVLEGLDGVMVSVVASESKKISKERIQQIIEIELRNAGVPTADFGPETVATTHPNHRMLVVGVFLDESDPRWWTYEIREEMKDIVLLVRGDKKRRYVTNAVTWATVKSGLIDNESTVKLEADLRSASGRFASDFQKANPKP